MTQSRLGLAFLAASIVLLAAVGGQRLLPMPWQGEIRGVEPAAAALTRAGPKAGQQPLKEEAQLTQEGQLRLEQSAGVPRRGFDATPQVEGWRITAPAIGIDARMVAVGLEPDGAMGAPDRADVVGWYRYGPAPGKPGNVLLDGHVYWTDRESGRAFPGVFWDLAKLRPGDRITLNDGAGEYVYDVLDKRRYRWDDPAGVFVLRPTDDARITMITCGGLFDRVTRNYSHRDVVIAQLVRG